VAQRHQLARPMVRRRARLHGDQAGRQLGEEAQDLGPAEPLAQNHPALRIDAVGLEHVLYGGQKAGQA
jgi:hypothetical protein